MANDGWTTSQRASDCLTRRTIDRERQEIVNHDDINISKRVGQGMFINMTLIPEVKAGDLRDAFIATSGHQPDLVA